MGAYLVDRFYAGFFSGDVAVVGNVIVVGNFSVAYGTKSAIVKHPDGSARQLYCMESPENWFEDFGVGELRNGHAHVQLDREFAALVRTDHYHVFLTPHGDSNGLYVSDTQPHSFDVREQQGGQRSLEFSYRIVAKRRDVDAIRLKPVQAPDKLRAPVSPPPPPQEPPAQAPPRRRLPSA
jgi:hypothetical protein